MEEQTILLGQIEQLNIKNNSLGEELRDSREQNEALTELLKQRDGRISRLESQLNELLRRIY
ncbi:MAG: hypothetical protein KKH34_01655, partial [Candidatus Omnitrophica bacterium]|nr:hypothetical protein [Candidatus Omnitrophota bacterium]